MVEFNSIFNILLAFFFLIWLDFILFVPYFWPKTYLFHFNMAIKNTYNMIFYLEWLLLEMFARNWNAISCELWTVFSSFHFVAWTVFFRLFYGRPSQKKTHTEENNVGAMSKWRLLLSLPFLMLFIISHGNEMAARLDYASFHYMYI